jgi:hypothetical protein
MKRERLEGIPMIESTVNIVVMVLFGVFIGSLVALFNALSEDILRPGQIKEDERKSGEGLLAYQLRIANERAELSKKIVTTGPRSFKMVYGALVLFIVMLVIVINFSTVHMHWLAFLLSALAGFVVAQLVYNQSKAGKIKTKGRFFFEPITEEKPPGGKVNNKS